MNTFAQIEKIYRFKCTCCGNCCSGDMEILLNPYDLYKIAWFCSYERTDELFNNDLVILVKGENGVWYPKISFIEKPFKFCPFLINELNDNDKLKGLCSLHLRHKPLVCALSPVGRAIDLGRETTEFVYVKPAPDCPGVNSAKENILVELIDKYEHELQYQYLFFRILKKIKSRNYNKKSVFTLLYSFSVDKPFDVIITKIIEGLEK